MNSMYVQLKLEVFSDFRDCFADAGGMHDFLMTALKDKLTEVASSV